MHFSYQPLAKCVCASATTCYPRGSLSRDSGLRYVPFMPSASFTSSSPSFFRSFSVFSFFFYLLFLLFIFSLFVLLLFHFLFFSSSSPPHSSSLFMLFLFLFLSSSYLSPLLLSAPPLLPSLSPLLLFLDTFLLPSSSLLQPIAFHGHVFLISFHRTALAGSFLLRSQKLCSSFYTSCRKPEKR